MSNSASTPRRAMILTGASRGIGHATVKRFSSAGWRVITCSRHAFPENCPWAAGPEDHIQVDLADPHDTLRAVAEMRERLQGGKLHALVNNAGISPKAFPPPQSGGGGPSAQPMVAAIPWNASSSRPGSRISSLPSSTVASIGSSPRPRPRRSGPSVISSPPRRGDLFRRLAQALLTQAILVAIRHRQAEAFVGTPARSRRAADEWRSACRAGEAARAANF